MRFEREAETERRPSNLEFLGLRWDVGERLSIRRRTRRNGGVVAVDVDELICEL